MRAVREGGARREGEGILRKGRQTLGDRVVRDTGPGLMRWPAQMPAIMPNTGSMRCKLTECHRVQMGWQIGFDLADRLIEIDETALHEAGEHDRSDRLRHGAQTHRSLCGQRLAFFDIGVAECGAPHDSARGPDTNGKTGDLSTGHPLVDRFPSLLGFVAFCGGGRFRDRGGTLGKPVPPHNLHRQEDQGHYGDDGKREPQSPRSQCTTEKASFFSLMRHTRQPSGSSLFLHEMSLKLW